MRVLNDEEIRKIIVDNFVKDGMVDASEYEWGVEDEQRDIAKTQYQKDLKDFIEWGWELCFEHWEESVPNRWKCIKCWQSLKELKGE